LQGSVNASILAKRDLNNIKREAFMILRNGIIVLLYFIDYLFIINNVKIKTLHKYMEKLIVHTYKLIFSNIVLNSQKIQHLIKYKR